MPLKHDDVVIDDPSGALIALDFDGTLSTIVPDPSQSRPVDGAVELLAELARRGARIAIVTGRDAETVRGLGELERIPGVVISGLHGAESWRDGELTTRAEPPGVEALRAELPPLLSAVDENIWLEDKRLSLVVHTRRSAAPEAALEELAGPVSQLAAAHGLEVVGGKLVLEIRIPGLSKADALDELLAEGATAAVFAGDDRGDLPAFGAVRRWVSETGRPGLTVAVGEVVEVRDSAMVSVESPAELVELLRSLAD